MTEPSSLQRVSEVVLQLPAGADSEGKPVLERVEAYALDREGWFELKRTPLFIRNLASGDVFRLSEDEPGEFAVMQRSGRLAIRVFRKSAVDVMERELTPEVEKLGGRLELASERALVYTLHVNIGFSAVEALFDGFMGRFAGSVWYYGNVYDPRDGVTPLNWWTEFLGQV